MTEIQIQLDATDIIVRYCPQCHMVCESKDMAYVNYDCCKDNHIIEEMNLAAFINNYLLRKSD